MSQGEVQIKKPRKTPLIGAPPDKPSWWDEKVDIFKRKKKPKKTSVLEEAFKGKPNFLSRMDVGAPYKAWRTATIAPIGSALAAAGLAGAGAYFAAPWIAKKIRARMKNLPEAAQMEMTDEEIDKMKRRMALLAALGVGGLSLATNFNPKYPVGSLFKWNYVPKGGIRKENSDKGLGKEASMLGPTSNAAVMQMDMIPLDHAKEIIANDKFLTSDQKAAIGTIFDKSPDQGGGASMADITTGAVRAGLGFAGGAIAGYALGKIFALPKSVTRVASVTGGLANALRTSGLIS